MTTLIKELTLGHIDDSLGSFKEQVFRHKYVIEKKDSGLVYHALAEPKNHAHIATRYVRDKTDIVGGGRMFVNENNLNTLNIYDGSEYHGVHDKVLKLFEPLLVKWYNNLLNHQLDFFYICEQKRTYKQWQESRDIEIASFVCLV